MSRTSLLLGVALAMLLPSMTLAQPDPTSDLMVEASVAATADPDTDVTFSVTLTNNGPDDAEMATLSDEIPAGMTFVSMTAPAGWTCDTPAVDDTGTITCTHSLVPASTSADFAIVLHIDAGTPPGVFFSNVFHAMTSTVDPNDENDAITATVQTPPPPPADLFVTIAAPAGANADTDVTYRVAVTNTRGIAATNVSLTFAYTLASLNFVSVTQTSGETFACDTMSNVVTCTRASLSGGTSATFDIVAHVPDGTPDGTTFQASANVESDVDPNDENDGASSLVCVQGNSCNAGLCNGGTAVVCDAPSQCQETNECDPMTGACVPTPKDDDTVCDDGTVCTTTDTCQGGICVGSTPLVCDDGNPCSADSCDPTNGCMSVGECDAGTDDAGTDDASTGDSGTDASTDDAGADGGGSATGGSGCDCAAHGASSPSDLGAWLAAFVIAGALSRARRRG